MKKFLRLVLEYLNGDFAYKNYLKRAATKGAQEKIMDKKSFLRHRQKCKWDKVNRCC
jgi:uncharacterized short protein YbdD (DUF466 family)